MNNSSLLLSFLSQTGDRLRKKRLLGVAARVVFYCVVTAIGVYGAARFTGAIPEWAAGAVIAAGLAGLAAFAATARKPRADEVARFVDRRLKEQEKFLTAEQCARLEKPNEIEEALIEQVAGECSGMAAARLAPMEPPWEAWGALAFAVAALVFVLLWVAQLLMAWWHVSLPIGEKIDLLQQMKKVEQELRKPEAGKKANDIADKLSQLMKDLAAGKKPSADEIKKTLLELPQVAQAMAQANGQVPPEVGRVAQFLSQSEVASKLAQALQNKDQKAAEEIGRQLAQVIRDTGAGMPKPGEQQQGAQGQDGQQAGAQGQQGQQGGAQGQQGQQGGEQGSQGQQGGQGQQGAQGAQGQSGAQGQQGQQGGSQGSQGQSGGQSAGQQGAGQSGGSQGAGGQGGAGGQPGGAGQSGSGAGGKQGGSGSGSGAGSGASANVTLSNGAGGSSMGAGGSQGGASGSQGSSPGQGGQQGGAQGQQGQAGGQQSGAQGQQAGAQGQQSGSQGQQGSGRFQPGNGAGLGGQSGQGKGGNQGQGSGQQGNAQGQQGQAGPGGGQGQAGGQQGQQGGAQGQQAGAQGQQGGAQGQGASGQQGEAGKDQAGKGANGANGSGESQGKDAQAGGKDGTSGLKDGQPGGKEGAAGAKDGNQQGPGGSKDGQSQSGGAAQGAQQQPGGTGNGSGAGIGAGTQGGQGPSAAMSSHERQLLDKLKQVAGAGGGKDPAEVLREMGKMMGGGSGAGHSSEFSHNVRKLAQQVREGKAGDTGGTDSPGGDGSGRGTNSGTNTPTPEPPPTSPEGTVVHLPGAAPDLSGGTPSGDSSGGVPTPGPRLPVQVTDPGKKRELQQQYKEDATKYLNKERVPAEYRDLIKDYFSY